MYEMSFASEKLSLQVVIKNVKILCYSLDLVSRADIKTHVSIIEIYFQVVMLHQKAL